MTPMEVALKLRARAALFAIEDKSIGIYADRAVESLLLTAAVLIEEGYAKGLQDLQRMAGTNGD